jgi:SRSO17 transposase
VKVSTATARIQAVIRWLERLQRCFGHRAQRLARRIYAQGVFSDSDRKSMQAMLAPVTQPVSCQAFQHFITDAPWDADRIWRRLLEILPAGGVLILDGASPRKEDPHSVGVAG